MEYLFLKLMFKKLKEDEQVWAQSIAFSFGLRYDISISKAVAKKLHIRYPYFAKKLADNYGYDLAEFIA